MKIKGYEIRARTFLLVVLLIMIGIQDLQHELMTMTGDFLHFWFTSQYEMKAEPEQLYAAATEGSANEFSINDSIGIVPKAVERMRYEREFVIVQSPFLYSVVGYLSSGDYDVDERVFHELSFLCLLSALAIFMFRSDYGLDEALLLAIFVLYSFYPVISDDANSNVNRIALFLVAVALALFAARSVIWRFPAGIMMALAVMVKSNVLFVPILLFLLRLQRKQWRFLRWETAGFFTGSLAAITAGSLFTHSLHSWYDWVLRNLGRHLGEDRLTDGNYSLPSLLLDLTGRDLSIAVAGIGLILVAVRIGKELFGKHAKVDNPVSMEEVRLIGAGGLVWLLCFPLVWSHYYTLALPMVVYILSPGWQGAAGPGQRLAAFAAIAAVAMPLYMLGGHMPHAVTGWMSWMGAFVLLLLGTGERRSPGQGLATEEA